MAKRYNILCNWICVTYYICPPIFYSIISCNDYLQTLDTHDRINKLIMNCASIMCLHNISITYHSSITDPQQPGAALLPSALQPQHPGHGAPLLLLRAGGSCSGWYQLMTMTRTVCLSDLARFRKLAVD